MNAHAGMFLCERCIIGSGCVHVAQVHDGLDGESVSLETPDLEDDDEYLNLGTSMRPPLNPILDPAQAETQVVEPLSPPQPSSSSGGAHDEADLDAKIAQIEQLA